MAGVEITRLRHFLSWAVREAAEGRMTEERFLNGARQEGLCVDRPQIGGGHITCTPWDSRYPEELEEPPMQPAPSAPMVSVSSAPYDFQAQHTNRIALELEGPDRRASWALDNMSEYITIRAVNVGRWTLPTLALRAWIERWRKGHPTWEREAQNGNLLLLVPTHEFIGAFPDAREPWRHG